MHVLEDTPRIPNNTCTFACFFRLTRRNFNHFYLMLCKQDLLSVLRVYMTSVTQIKYGKT